MWSAWLQSEIIINKVSVHIRGVHVCSQVVVLWMIASTPSRQSILPTNEFIEHIYESNNGNGTVYNIHQQWNTRSAVKMSTE